MSNDIVKRLRCYADADNAVWHPWVYRESADRIEAQAARIERQDARIAELKTELKIWWDENVKNKIACQRKDDRIAELEAALRFYADPFKYTDIHGDDVQVPDFYSETDFGETARAALEGKKDD